MAAVAVETGSRSMASSMYPVLEEQRQGQASVTEGSLSPTHVLSPASSLDSETSLADPEDDPSARVDLSPSQEDQIEKLKEFLSEAQVRGDDYVTQNDADTVKALENMQIGSSTEVGLGVRLESAARENLEIEKQIAAGYFPSETVYLQEHTLKEVIDQANPVLSVAFTGTIPKETSPSSSAASPLKSPRAVEADAALKNELDCLFQERAAKFQLE